MTSKKIYLTTSEPKQLRRCIFIHVDRMRYGARISQVNDGVVLGIDKHPMNLDKAYAILAETKKQQERVRRRQSGSSTD